MNLDQTMMHQCIELAKKALGKTAPNPLVGSIIVKDGKIIGQGYHPEAGKPHAEVFALKEAGAAAAGATVYVSLEPCNHYGRTPPCTEALIAAKVAKVVVGMVDPNPLVGGNGIKRLQAAGIEVVTGVAESACRQLNEAFIHRILYKKPFGILKYAMTLDGKIAATTGHSAWVTSKASRQRVHQLRSTCDGIIIGGNTVRKDNPNLTTHGLTAHNPLRIVMTRTCDLPESCNLWDTSIAPTLIFTRPDSNPQLQEKLLTKGVEIIHLETVTPEAVMNHLYQKGLSQVLWECGGILAANAIASQAVQKVMAFIAPKIIGGQTAPSPVGDMGLTQMTQALLLDKISLEKIEEDILIKGYLT
ncbi:MAG: bifunctional diaminohydroxyphosphoribosylaminopyrimidine deaminase/5-amino-6-(5-phosphoribosylamino)uracil reductase RibD [Xenococcaceae cyanobacterium MO_188.B19]|nr:bifunctional diaminohydroxyphosphoribosylaminopyrimidine deaminase/5-amino-6-(5-phosphoribosylamino)uracil reductase RibD [Xenococcaceae cyanobacterium MO_188.B19]